MTEASVKRCIDKMTAMREALLITGCTIATPFIMNVCAQYWVESVWRYKSFLQRVSIACYTERCTRDYYLSVRPFVRLSIRLWYCLKMTKARITRSSLTDSPRISFCDIRLIQKFEGVKWEDVRKSADVRPLSHRVSETVQEVAIDH